MSITKTLVRERIPLEYHRVTRLVWGAEGIITAMVSSWGDLDDYVQGGKRVTQTAAVLLTPPVPGPTMFADIEQQLVLDPDCDFFGGTVEVDPPVLQELDVAKLQKWQAMVRERDTREYGTFTINETTISIDARAQARLQMAYNLAVDAKAAGTAFSIEWSDVNDAAVTLNANQTIALAKAVFQHIQSLHDTARALRAQIRAATTAEEVAAIVWPTP